MAEHVLDAAHGAGVEQLFCLLHEWFVMPAIGNQQRQVALSEGLDADRFTTASRQADLQEQIYIDAWAGLMDVEAKDLTTAYGPTVDFSTGVKGQAVDDIGNGLAEALGLSLVGLQNAYIVETKFAGHEGEATRNNAGAKIQNSLETLKENNPELIEQIRKDASKWLPSGGFFQDAQFDMYLTHLTRMALTGETSMPSHTMEYTPGDWFSQLGPNKLNVAMSLINGTAFSQERSGSQGSFMSSLFRTVGTIAGAWAGGAGGAAATDAVIEAID